ncbi:hypothetical protein B0H67DRAFT_644983 [Lasiosphaeris hirsuta]|uniref:Uncharacterized protein n=1 Tax=Lasiosphaeris hirsuta TaxID=260670 RepID=A0AA40DXE2_9PEZI|nr:hypothetical protein B0H67DRAFT_644983 [Lasiosphaeris hirsuta]
MPGFLTEVVAPSFWYFTGMNKCICAVDNTANRTSLILYNPDKARRLKLGVGIAIGIINVSVFIVWIPARLQISQDYIEANNIWDRIEKFIFLIIDLIWNAYFM